LNNKLPLPALIKPRLWFGIAFAMLGVVAYFSLIPNPPGADINDKLLHFSAYTGLSAGFSTLVHSHRQLSGVAVGLIGFGILIEILQGLTGYRFMEALDVLANSVGVLCGLLIRLTPFPRWFRLFESRLFTA